MVSGGEKTFLGSTGPGPEIPTVGVAVCAPDIIAKPPARLAPVMNRFVKFAPPYPERTAFTNWVVIV